MEMTVTDIKRYCNKLYDEAIVGMERGIDNATIRLKLLECAECLIKLGKLTPFEARRCEESARKLLDASKQIKADSDLSGVYNKLTGRILPVKAAKPTPSNDAVNQPKSSSDAELTKTSETHKTSYAPSELPDVSELDNLKSGSVSADRSSEHLDNSAYHNKDASPMDEVDELIRKISEDNAANEKAESVTSDSEPQSMPSLTDKNTAERTAEKESITNTSAKTDSPKDDKKGESENDNDKNTPYELQDTGEEVIKSYEFNWDITPKVGFDDVAGLYDVKEAVRNKVLMPLKHPELYEGYVTQNGGGLLLYGPPGTGKTMIAAAIAKEIGAKFCTVGPSDLVLGGVGRSEQAIKRLFAEARSFKCAIIFFDEMDALSPARTQSQISRQIRSELLRQIQGLDSYGKDDGQILFLIAATNKPWDIDSAFIRPGRFGTRIYVQLPDKDARRYMIESKLNKIREVGIVNVSDDINLDEIVEKTAYFNGADVNNVLTEVQELSIKRFAKTGVKSITNEDFMSVLERVTSSVQMSDIQRLKAWREENA